MPLMTRSRSTDRLGRRPAALLVAGLGVALVAGACAPGDVSDAAARGPLDGRSGEAAGGRGHGGGTGVGSTGLGERGGGQDDDQGTSLAPLPIATLTDQEVESLLTMREEEKLAHDVYVALGETWGSRIFENIARAEANHVAAVKALLDRYDIADPADDLAIGEFTDPEVRALYDELVTRGRTSITEAFAVGAQIEDLDISDLRERATDTQDIDKVFDALEQGSENHLRAFVRNLDRLGVTYTPTYLSAEEYESIIGSSHGQGRPA